MPILLDFPHFGPPLGSKMNTDTFLTSIYTIIDNPYTQHSKFEAMLRGSKKNFNSTNQEAKQLNETKLKNLHNDYSSSNLTSYSDLVLSNLEVSQLSDSSLMMEVDLLESAEENSSAQTGDEGLAYSTRKENESAPEMNTGQTNVE